MTLTHSQDRTTSAALLYTVIFHFIPKEHLASLLGKADPQALLCSVCTSRSGGRPSNYLMKGDPGCTWKCAGPSCTPHEQFSENKFEVLDQTLERQNIFVN